MIRFLGQLSTIAAMVFVSCMVHAVTIETPGCANLTPKQCLSLALDAMGGQQKLEAIQSIQLDIVSHTALVEQSYRQAPFITSYERDKTTIDIAGKRMRTEAHLIWPEADPHQAEVDATLIATPSGGVYHSAQGDSPCQLSDIDNARETLALGPVRALLTALQASDLRFETPQTLRSTAHTVIAFTWNKVPVRLLINPFNHLPDAVETTEQFHDFWYHWGDVQQRTYWDNWHDTQGIVYPTNEVVERNGAIWNSHQALDVQFNVPVDEKNFAMDAKAVQQSAVQKGWERPFRAANSVQLASGIDLYLGSWNATIIHEPDGVIILESPISGTFVQGIFDEAKKKYPGDKITAVLSTSDSWPHIGGVRFDVSQGLPVYILDLNQPLLDRMMAAPHTITPDALQLSPKKPDWKIVSGKVEIGSGPNRMELYPLRGASTERQYMVYFPEHHLLYASDTLVLNQDHTLYDPQLMHEVEQAVEREHLSVEKVYAMHEGPTAWSDVLALLTKSG
ncbi:MAG TPA: MBL fold metallo-hydrolase [Pseudacidobacterium sp.]|jgi:hypothetical protein|nr:MBL fold metallo-hydrolase [Pseudacidobacterium sp.]